ncbi:MAG: GntR family transcriptional regulator [Bacteroidales bacterium]|nr:GntR family transcriptional regulator [Bacteroidales bacterium]
MAEIGKYNNLQIVKILDFGAYIDGGDKGEILLPIRQVPPNLDVDDFIEVFIYNDSEDRIIATSHEPFAIAGEFALLKAIGVNKFGAFMDWGLEKDLLVPFREQRETMQEGRWYLVYIYLDEQSQRLAASAKLDRFLNKTEPEFEENQEVDLIIRKKTDLGYTAIINNTHLGLLYDNEIFQELRIGQKLKGFVKQIREDDKIDLSLNKIGYEFIDEFSETILEKLKLQNNFISITDKSSPEDIYSSFSMSKKNFKKAVGSLYKKRLIAIEEKGIRFIG